MRASCAGLDAGAASLEREGRVALCARPERDALAARRHNPYPNSQMQIAQALFLDSHTIPYTGLVQHATLYYAYTLVT